MKGITQECVTATTASNIKFEENKKSIIFSNPQRKEFKKIKVDGCAISDGSILRCDFALCSGDWLSEYYVELKGTDVSHAIDQLESTIDLLGEHNDNRHAYIICANVAPKLNSSIQKAKKAFKSKFNSELVIKENRITVTV